MAYDGIVTMIMIIIENNDKQFKTHGVMITRMTIHLITMIVTLTLGS
jgi:hypothetical protein